MSLVSQFQSDVSQALKPDSTLSDKKTVNIAGAQFADNSGKLSLFQDSGLDRREPDLTRVSPEKASHIEEVLLGETNNTSKTMNDKNNQVQGTELNDRNFATDLKDNNANIVYTFYELDSIFRAQFDAKVSKLANKIIEIPLKLFKSK